MQNYYQNIADTFDKDPYGLYKTSREMAIGQLREFISPSRKLDTLLDLNVGTGNSFLFSKEYFEIKQYIGNDISSSMLKIALKRFPHFKAICDDALNIRQHVADHSVDLLYIHYLLSYVDVRKILMIAKEIIKPDGMISILTTTKNSLIEIQEDLSKYAPILFDREKFLKKYLTPSSADELMALANDFGFATLKQETYRKQITFENFTDVWDFGVNAGWLIQYFSITGNNFIDKLFFRMVSYLLEKFSKKLSYPVSATMELCVMTIQLKNPEKS